VGCSANDEEEEEEEEENGGILGWVSVSERVVFAVTGGVVLNTSFSFLGLFNNKERDSCFSIFK